MPSAGPFPSPVMPTQHDADVPNQRVAEHRRSTATSCRSTKISASFAASLRANSTSQPNARTDFVREK
jgi:hypothetical protein